MRRTAIVATKKGTRTALALSTAGCLPNESRRDRFSYHPQGAGDQTEPLPEIL